MTKRILPFVFLALVAAAQFCVAAIKFVSPNPGSAPYTSISTAYNAAAPGDTIVIGPGTYQESFGVADKRVHIIGAGWDVCTWNGYLHMYYAGTSGTVVEGIKFAASGYYTLYPYSNADSITIRRCNVSCTPGYTPLYLGGGRVYVNDCVLNAANNVCVILATTANGNVVFRNTVFNLTTPHPSYTALSGANGGTVEIYNCAFLNYAVPFGITGIPQVIGLNNIFWDWNPTAAFGQLPVGSVFEYSAAGGDAPSWPSNFAHNIDLGNNNPFVNYNNAGYYEYGVSDLHLNTNTGGNLCRDAGYPSIQDLDSTAADLGIYGGPKPFVDNGVPAYPFALTLTIDNLVEVGDSVNVVSSGRIGPRY